MKENIGTADMLIRQVIAAILLLLFSFQVISGLVGFVLLGISIFCLLTSLFSYCPLYAAFGINTCRTSNNNKNKNNGSRH